MQYINTWSPAFKRFMLCTAVGLALTLSSTAKFSESDPLPDLSDFGLVGEIPELKGKVILLDFWASWCAPCKASFPAMDEIYLKYKEQGLVILAVSVDDSAAAFKKFADKSDVSFPLLHDAGKKLVASAEIEAMPTSFLIDKQGVIRFVHNGFQGKKTLERYHLEIQNLIAEKS